MEHKAWLWRKKSSEKTIIISDKSDLSLVESKQEKERALELEISLKDLNELLSYARIESIAKDDLLAKQAKVAEEAIKGWEKAEAEAASFKQELDEALLQKSSFEESKNSIDESFKECMQQLHALKEEKQLINSDAAFKISREQEKSRILEDRLAKLKVENSNLHRLVEVKEKLIDELCESKSKSEANFNELMVRLDSTEKANASLNYEVSMLQKEHEFRNKDRDFNLKSADAAHKQHLESIKKISKLETECQRLRVMVRKRLPGPAALAKMRSEVEMLGNSAIEIRRKRSSYVSENYYDSSSKSVASLLERLNMVEDENKILKETLSKKNNELQSSRVMFARTASKLSVAETQLEGLSKGQASLEIARNSPVSYDLPLGSISEDGCNEDTISCTESWASALIFELEHFKTGIPMTPTHRTATVSDLSLMNDFVEMEKLAIVCADTDSKPDRSEATGLELVPMDGPSDASETNRRTQSSYISFEKLPNLLQDILRVVLEKHQITQRSLDAILEEVRVALGDLSVKVNCQHSSSDSFDAAFPMYMRSGETRNQLCQSELERSVCKLIELIEGIIRGSKAVNKGTQMPSGDGGVYVPYPKSMPLTGYVPHVFLWESSELSDVLQRFTIVCNDVLYGKAHLEKFAGEFASTLEWIINHCFSLQDVSIMKDMIKKHFDGDESHGDDEFEVKINNGGIEKEKLDTPEELMVGRSSPLLTTSNGLYILPQMDIESTVRDENKSLEDDTITMESRKKDLKKNLELASAKNGTLIIQLQESKESICNLQLELDILRESEGLIEDRIESQEVISDDLGPQLKVAKLDLNESCQKFSTLEVEPDEKSNCFDESEAACLELQLPLESVTSKETLKYGMVQEEEQLRTDWEISVATKKLAECQETILNLGKQLKALASPIDAALFDKVIATPASTGVPRRPKLLDQLRAEDETISEDPKSPKTKVIICTEPQNPSAATSENPNAGLLYGRKILTKHKADTHAGTLALVPKRQKGGVGLLRRILSRRKKETSKMLMLRVSS